MPDGFGEATQAPAKKISKANMTEVRRLAEILAAKPVAIFILVLNRISNILVSRIISTFYSAHAKQNFNEIELHSRLQNAIDNLAVLHDMQSKLVGVELDQDSKNKFCTEIWRALEEQGLTSPVVKQLYCEFVRDVFAYSAQIEGLPTKLPEYGAPDHPPLYGLRGNHNANPSNWEADAKLNALQFYDKYWRKFADAGLLFQFHLRQLDGALLNGINTKCRREGIDPAKYLPPPKKEYTNSVLAGVAPLVEDAKKAKKALHSRKSHAIAGVMEDDPQVL